MFANMTSPHFKHENVNCPDKVKGYYFLFNKLYNKLIKLAKKKGFTDEDIDNHPIIMASLMMEYIKTHPNLYF